MTGEGKLIIEPLGPRHEKSSFRCGVDSLDRYIAQQAGQDVRRHTSRVFVAISPHEPGAIVGYYTLSALSIGSSSLPPKLAKKLPRHPIPAALLGRLAVSERHREEGIGRMLLADAVKRCLAVGEEIAIYALVVDPEGEEAARFYEQLGFRPLGDEHTRLFLPLRSFDTPS